MAAPASLVVKVHKESEFDAQLVGAGDKLVIVDFFATWCGPCLRIAPFLDGLSVEYKDVLFVKVDVDELEDLAAKYGVSAMPTFQAFKHGKRVDSLVGASPDGLRALVTKNK